MGVNAEPVYLQALDGWLSAQGTNGLHALFNLRCNRQIEPMKAWLDFSATDAPEQPPQVTIDMPSSVTCRTIVDLDAIVSDPDGDLETLEWELDGVLLSASVEEIQVDEVYNVRATLRDERGATATDVHVIECTPP